MRVVETIERVIQNVERVMIGQRQVIELSVIALLSEGHVLIEDVPGVGKTALVHAIATTFDLPLQRIQFTPDVLPTDIIGVSIYNPKEGVFQFQPGPIFGSMILADELNRASPKTQSALLESMEERFVSVDGHRYALPYPFFVMATQNPMTHQGTYPLPEAQLDRFLFKVQIGYPSYEEEVQLLAQHATFPTLSPVVTVEQLKQLREDVEQVYVHAQVQQYIVQLLRTSREHEAIELGLSPRSGLALQRACRALAAIRGRHYVTPDDVQYLFPYVASHRLQCKRDALFNGMTIDRAIEDMLRTVVVPTGVFA